MNKLKEIKEGIAELSDNLKKYQNEIKGWMSKPDVSAWFKVEIGKHMVELKALGLPAQQISSSIISCKKDSKKILVQIAVLGNAGANLQADLMGSVDLNDISLSAKKLASKHKLLESEVTHLYKQINFLSKAKQKLNEGLTIQNLLKFSWSLAAKQTGAFEKGLALFRLFFPHDDGKSNQKTLASYKKMGEKLTARFQGLELCALPNLAEEIVHRQVNIGLLTTQQIYDFIAAVERRFTSEHNQKKRLEEKLEQLGHQESISMTLTEFKTTANSLCKLVISLSGKYALYEHMCMIPKIHEHLNVFHLSLKNSLIAQAQADSKILGSAINPETIAAKKTKTYFFGLKGVVRSIKLMYSSIKGKQAINEIELLQILEKAICTCRIFYGNSAADIQKLKAFIDNLLQDYARPFPYTSLFTLVKKTIAEYGSQVENYVQDYTIDEKYRTLTETPIPVNLGKLSTELSKNHQHFTQLLKGL